MESRGVETCHDTARASSGTQIYLPTPAPNPWGRKEKKMGNYKSRRPGFLQGWQIVAADLMFRGFTDEEIGEKIWKTDGDPKKVRNAKARLRNLRKDEKFQEYYRSIITEWTVHNIGKALNKLSEQIDSNLPWLSNKAANDVLVQSKPFLGNDDNTVVVRLDGIELGTPDDN